ncbi:MAG: hypothetical protein WAW73_20335 [Rhodoferax sp.]
METDTKDDQKPNIEERYTGATHASNLKVEAERSGAADLLIAMGWSPTRLGAALLRLHSEWDACEKPRRPTREAVDLLAASMPRLGEGKNVVDHVGARQKAHDWYMHELKILFGKLKTMPEVRQQLVMWAQKQAIEKPDHRVAEVLAWWLDHTCPACEGRGKERIANTPALSLRPCKVCRGTGETRLPHRQGYDNYVRESERMLKHIEVCIKTAQTSVRQRLQGFRRAG